MFHVLIKGKCTPPPCLDRAWGSIYIYMYMWCAEIGVDMYKYTCKCICKYCESTTLTP